MSSSPPEAVVSINKTGIELESELLAKGKPTSNESVGWEVDAVRIHGILGDSATLSPRMYANATAGVANSTFVFESGVFWKVAGCRLLAGSHDREGVASGAHPGCRGKRKEKGPSGSPRGDQREKVFQHEIKA